MMKRFGTFFISMLIILSCATPRAEAHSHPNDAQPASWHVSSWAEEEIHAAQREGMIPPYNQVPNDYRQPITRAQFRVVAMNYVALQQRYDTGPGETLYGMVTMYLGEADEFGFAKRVFSDGSDEDSVASYLGIVEGRGDGTFDPDGLITRQEAAVMLGRAYSVCGGTISRQTAGIFNDDTSIAVWAADSVSSLATWGVMKGMEDGSFHPTDFLSVEQCLIAFLRLYEQAPVSHANGNIRHLFTYEECLDYLASKEKGLQSAGLYEVQRVEGSMATFIRLDTGGMTTASGSSLYMAYRDGGLKEIDIGICSFPELRRITGHTKLYDCHFSDDGKTFYCVVPLLEDIMIDSETVAHKKGTYHISLDIETNLYSLEFDEQ